MRKDTFEPKLAVTAIADQLGISTQAVHKHLKREGFTTAMAGNKGYITHSMAKRLFSPKFEKKSFAFQIVKGGTGKTTAMYNISCGASIYGAKILVIDIDPQGNATDAFNIEADNTPVLIDVVADGEDIRNCIVHVTEGIDLIPSRIENVVLDSKLAMDKTPLHTFFANLLEPIENNYDFIFIDCPPTMGHAVTAASLYAKTVVVPLNPDKFSAKGLSILKDEINEIKKNYKIGISYKVFLNKFSGNTILSDKTISTTISEEIEKGNALQTAIRQAQEIPNVTDEGLNLFSSLKKSTARDDFDLLTKELLGIDISSLWQNKSNLHVNEEATEEV